MAKTPKPIATVGAKWARRTSQAGGDFQDGVQRATDWAGPAVAAAPRRNAGLQQAIADGRIDAGIQRAGTNGWRSATLAKGVPAYTQNTPKAQPKFEQGLQRVYSYLAEAEQATASMDTTTVEGRVQKAAAYQLAVHQAALRDKTGR